MVEKRFNGTESGHPADGSAQISRETKAALLEGALSSKERVQKFPSAEEKARMLAKLKQAHSIKEQALLFGKWADDYGLEVAVSLVPGYGDAVASIVCSLYFLYQGLRMNLPIWNIVKILGLQAFDFAVGLMPVVGDGADYFFKANKWSAKLFAQHFEKLTQEAIEQEFVTKADIEHMQHNDAKFVKAMNVIYDQKFAKAS